MRKNLLTAIPLILFSHFLFGQEQTFIYSRGNGAIHLVSDSDTISMHNYAATKNRTRDRKVILDGNTYTFSITKTKDRTQTISDEGGTPQATVSLGTKNRYDIKLEDGTVMECSVVGKTWTYAINAQEVIKVSLKKENGQKKILLTRLDQRSIPPAVLLSCLERATDRYVSAASTAPIIISAFGLALLRAATIQNNQPEF